MSGRTQSGVSPPLARGSTKRAPPPKVCLRCDWAGDTDGSSCPACGAALYLPHPDHGSEASSGTPSTVAPPAPTEDPAPLESLPAQLASWSRSTWRLVALAALLVLAIAGATGYLLGREAGPPATVPSLTGPSPSPSVWSPPSAPEKATFRSARPAYSFRYPSSWKPEEDATATTPVAFSFRRGGGAGETGTLGTVTLTLDKVPLGTTLAAYGRATRHRMTRHGDEVLATRLIIMGERRGLVIRYRVFKWYIEFTDARFIALDGAYAYRLTYERPERDFDETYARVAAVAESFRFG